MESVFPSEMNAGNTNCRETGNGLYPNARVNALASRAYQEFGDFAGS
jgi:hypothetical protein